MSVTTTRRLDQARFDLAVGGGYEWSGGQFERAVEKTFTGIGGTTDQQISNAVTVAGDFFDTQESNLASLVVNAKAAVDANKTYLAIASPTNAQVVAQVRALTQQMNRLIRLTVGDLTGTDQP